MMMLVISKVHSIKSKRWVWNRLALSVVQFWFMQPRSSSIPAVLLGFATGLIYSIVFLFWRKRYLLICSFSLHLFLKYYYLLKNYFDSRLWARTRLKKLTDSHWRNKVWDSYSVDIVPHDLYWQSSLLCLADWIIFFNLTPDICQLIAI